ncbi:unnamed protein product [Vitrella brassicaformis CCMP3155]|uniref:Spatacsin C-terminal domain-containing protein n=1 Tax=Vitrella brassicaformis (strain CCMP3155) TaxID=1169540 RepID=A0A0G4FZ60_VITBC|nr:unnamed protein product [Vitrella brassicaformis CCMP3155]|eukprot:CEM20910.1 unnamed protein product [Vitrella brassicaformis CCMP3155]
MEHSSPVPLVCVRRFSRPLSLPSYRTIALSHDRSILALIHQDGTVEGYGCRLQDDDGSESTAAAALGGSGGFYVSGALESGWTAGVWLQVPGKVDVELDKQALRKLPGGPCLVVLREGGVLSFVHLVEVTQPNLNVISSDANQGLSCSLSEGPNCAVVGWPQLGSLHPNTLLRVTVDVQALLSLLTEGIAGSAESEGGSPCERGGGEHEHEYEHGDGGDEEGDDVIGVQWKPTEESKIRLCCGQPDSLLLLVDDVLAMHLTVDYDGLWLRRRFFLQRPTPPPPTQHTTFVDVAARQHWLFALTPPPCQHLLIWRTLGVAFHAIPITECVGPGDVYFTHMAVSGDLLAVALLDRSNDVWLLELDKYFDRPGIASLDWDLVKERHRAVQGGTLLTQTTKDYRALSTYPDAFHLTPDDLQPPTPPQRPPPHSGPAAPSSSPADFLRNVIEALPVSGIPVFGGMLTAQPDSLAGLGLSYQYDRHHHRRRRRRRRRPATDRDEPAGGEMDAATADEEEREKQRVGHVSRGFYASSQADAVRSVDAGCVPYEWFERMDRVDEALDTDRRWVPRRGGPRQEGAAGGGATMGDDYSDLTGDGRSRLRIFPRPNGFIAPCATKPATCDDALNAELQVAIERQAAAGRHGRPCPYPPWLTRFILPSLPLPATPTPLPPQPIPASDKQQQQQSPPSAQLSPCPSDASSPLAQQQQQQQQRPLLVRVHLTSTHLVAEMGRNEADSGPIGLSLIPRRAAGRGGGVHHVSSERGLDEWTKPMVLWLGEGWRGLVTASGTYYVLGRSELKVPVHGQSAQAILSNLLAFESRGRAAALCALNQWDATQLCALTLFLGLKFRELTTVQQSLGILRPDHEMAATRLIVRYIDNGYSCDQLQPPLSLTPSPPPAPLPHTPTPTPAHPHPTMTLDKSFASRLLDLAVRFVSRLIHSRVRAIEGHPEACTALTYLQPQHASRPQAMLMHELQELTQYLQSLRSLQQQLIATLPDAEAHQLIVHQTPPQAPTEGEAVGVSLSPAAAVGEGEGGLRVSVRREMWPESCDKEVVIREALLTGRVSSALVWFHRRREISEREQQALPSDAAMFDHLRHVAGRMAYQLTCNQQVDFMFVAVHMLRNVGANVNLFFKAVAFHTSKRLVRRRLLNHLRHMRRLSGQELQLIEMVTKLESEYPNPCFTAEYNRLWTALTTTKYPKKPLPTVPAFLTWPAGGESALRVGLACDGAVGGDVKQGVAPALQTDLTLGGRHAREANPLYDWVVSPPLLGDGSMAASGEELLPDGSMSMSMGVGVGGGVVPIQYDKAQDFWSNPQNLPHPPPEALEAWHWLTCGDVDDLDPTPLFGLKAFTSTHNTAGIEHAAAGGAGGSPSSSKESGGGGSPMSGMAVGIEGDFMLGDDTAQTMAANRGVCHQCRIDATNEIELGGGSPLGSVIRLHRHRPIPPHQPAHLGYLHVTLAWVAEWPAATCRRILMEKRHFTLADADNEGLAAAVPRGKDDTEVAVDATTVAVSARVSLPSVSPSASSDMTMLRDFLDFSVAHHDWRGIVQWVARLPLAGCKVDEHGIVSAEIGPSHPLLRLLNHVETAALPRCTPFLAEILLQELANIGIFCASDVQGFPALLRRLAKSRHLYRGFGERGAERERERVRVRKAVSESAGEKERAAVTTGVKKGTCLDLDPLLPRGAPSPLHRFVISLCIEHDLASVLVLYLQHYQLATSLDDLNRLAIDLSRKAWAALLMIGRLGNRSLFAVSLHHAAAHIKEDVTATGEEPTVSEPPLTVPSVRVDAQQVEFMNLDAIAREGGRDMMFLATLMVAPVASGLEALKADKALPWHVSEHAFRQVLSQYPILWQAFFPDEPPHAPQQHQNGKEAPLSPLTSSLIDVVHEQQQRLLTQLEEHRDISRPPPPRVRGRHRPPQAQQQEAPAAASKADPSWVHSVKDDATAWLATHLCEDISTYKKDISLFRLLSDVASLDVHRLLKPLPIFKQLFTQRETHHEARRGEAFSSMLASPDGAFRDGLGVSYYLAQGRPLMAFHLLLTGRDRQTARQKDVTLRNLPLALDDTTVRELQRVALSVALHNLLNEGVVSSVVCLLELCSLDTELLRVDVQSARRIYQHQLNQQTHTHAAASHTQGGAAGAGGGGVSVVNIEGAGVANVIQLFLSFPAAIGEPSLAASSAGISSPHLLTALRMLEEATWALDPHLSAASSSASALTYDSPWHLVALFCRVHQLPRSLTLLHELARNNDWVMFLHESDLQQCPPDTVLDIVHGYFTDRPLQSHLRIVANAILEEQHNKTAHTVSDGDRSSRRSATVEESSPDGSDASVVDLLLECRKGGAAGGTGARLLMQALNTLTPRLAIFASAFADVTPAQCMAAWLFIQTSTAAQDQRAHHHHQQQQQGEQQQQQQQQPEPPTSPRLMHHPSEDAWRQDEQKKGGREDDSGAGVVGRDGGQQGPVSLAVVSSPSELSSMISSLCRQGSFGLVLRALRFFDPTSALVHFVLFHRSFMQCRFSACRRHLMAFVKRRDGPATPPPAAEGEDAAATSCLPMDPHVVALANDTVQFLIDEFPTRRPQLLRLLHESGYSSQHSLFHFAFTITQKNNLEVDFRSKPSEILQLLLSKRLFSEARSWAKTTDMNGDSITFEEVTCLLVEFRQGVWWEVLDERMQLWHKCYNLFLLHNYPKHLAANFFLDLTAKLEQDLYAREQALLLSVAAELCPEGSMAAPPTSTAISPAGKTAPSPPPAPPDHRRRKGRRRAGKDDAVRGGEGPMAAAAGAAGGGADTAGTNEIPRQEIEDRLLLILAGSAAEVARDLCFEPLNPTYANIRHLLPMVPDSLVALAFNQLVVPPSPPSMSEDDNNHDADDASDTSSTQPPPRPRPKRPPATRGPEDHSKHHRNTADDGAATSAGSLPYYLEQAIANLINRDQIGWAWRLARRFQLADTRDIELAEAMLEVACGRWSDGTTQTLEAMGDGDFGRDSGKALTLLASQCSKRIGSFCRRLQVYGDVATRLGIDVQEAMSQNPTALLDQLLGHAVLPSADDEAVPLCRAFMAVCDPQPSANDTHAATIVRRFVSSQCEHFASTGEAMRWCPSRLEAFVSLCGSPKALGDEAAGKAMGGGLPLDCEVELLILAYTAYVGGCCERPITELLQWLEQRSHHYTASGPNLLLRLLAAVPEYPSMQHMLQQIVDASDTDSPSPEQPLNQLLRLAGGRDSRESESVKEPSLLCAAVVDFLHWYRPRDVATMVRVHMQLGLTSALGELLQREALRVLSSVSQDAALIYSSRGEETLMLAMQLMLEASEQFLASDRFQLHLVSNRLAALIALQLKAIQIALTNTDESGAGGGGLKGRAVRPFGSLQGAGALPSPSAASSSCGVFVRHLTDESSVVSESQLDAISAAGHDVEDASRIDEVPPPDPLIVVNLSYDEVQDFLTVHPDFIAALTVAEAYEHLIGPEVHAVWPATIFHQVVVRGNFGHLKHLTSAYPLDEDLLDALTDIYLSHTTQRGTQTQAGVEPLSSPVDEDRMQANMKRLLREAVPNREMRAKVAGRLGDAFADLCALD